MDKRRSRNENCACWVQGFGKGWCLWDLGLEPKEGIICVVCAFVFWGSGCGWLQKGVSHLSAKRRSLSDLICTGLRCSVFLSLHLNSNTGCSCCHGPFVTQLQSSVKGIGKRECLPPVVRKVRKTSCIDLTKEELNTHSDHPFQTEKWSLLWRFKALLNSADASQSSHRVFV